MNGTAGTAVAVAVGGDHSLVIQVPEPSAFLHGLGVIGALALLRRRSVGSRRTPVAGS